MLKFFGQYLLEKKILSREQLLEALKTQRTKLERLGDLAIRRGYLTAADVEKIRKEQQNSSLLFGETAAQMGLLSDGRVNELLNMQQSSHVYLGQVIADLGFIPADEIEKHFQAFQAEEGGGGANASVPIPLGIPNQDVLIAIAEITQRHFLRTAAINVKIAGIVDEKGITENPFVSVNIDFRGDMVATLRLKLSREVAVQVLANFGGQTFVMLEEELMKDAISEFFNILCGNLATKLLEVGKSCEISVPRAVMVHEQKLLALPGKAKAATLPLYTSEGLAWITFITDAPGGTVK